MRPLVSHRAPSPASSQAHTTASSRNLVAPWAALSTHLLGLLSSRQSSPGEGNPPVLTAHQVREDLDFLTRTIETSHPNPSWRLRKTAWDDKVRDLRRPSLASATPRSSSG